MEPKAHDENKVSMTETHGAMTGFQLRSLPEYPKDMLEMGLR